MCHGGRDHPWHVETRFDYDVPRLACPTVCSFLGARVEHRKSKRTFNEPGHAHFLTYSCHGRLPLLSKELTRRWVIDAMVKVRQRHELDVLAYVIMPEHVHQLVLPRNRAYRM